MAICTRQWIPPICAVTGMLMAPAVSAKVQTFTYLALNSTPRYAYAAAMPYANPHAPKGGMMRFAANGTFDNLNSMNGKGTAAEGVQYLYDSLLQSSLDEGGVKYPLLASSVSYDPERPAFAIFHLNPKARFSDGSPVTAQDVVATFEIILSKGAPGIRMYFADIAKVRALSPYRVRFDFKSDHNKQLPLMVSQVSIFSAQDLKKRNFGAVSLQPPLGSGPYVVDKIDAGQRIRYRRNPHYWGQQLAINRGAYNVDEIEYIYYRDVDIAFEGFKNGQYTIQEENTARRWANDYTFKAVRQGWIKKLNYRHYNPIPTESFALNTRRAPLNDIFFRQALSYAYDFEWQNKALFYGQYQRLQSFFDNSELAATGTPSPAEHAILKSFMASLSPVMQRGVFLDWRYPVSDGSGFNRYHLLVARQILLNHGYRYNQKAQLIDRHNRPIKLEFLMQQEGLQRTLMPYIQHLKRLGIEVHLRAVDTPQYIERRRHYDFDITPFNLPQSLNPGSEQQRFWSCESALQSDNYNYAGICHPAIDQTIQHMIHAPNRDVLIDQTRVLDRLLRAGYYYVLTYGKPQKWYAYWDMYQHAARLPLLDVGWKYWWVNSKRQAELQRQFNQQHVK